MPPPIGSADSGKRFPSNIPQGSKLMNFQRHFLTSCVAVYLLGGASFTPAAHAQARPSEELCKQVTPKRAKTNCALVVDFYDGFFNRRDLGSAERVVAPSYIQHNPDTPDGRKALVDYFTGYLKEHPKARSRIVRVSASGDLVWLHVHDTSSPDDRGSAVVDIFRVQRGLIVEHWDVIQPVPEKQANNNTMF